MYNNPYNFYPFVNNSMYAVAKPSIFKAFSNIKWGSLLTNTQKTLNVINQAIPVYYQIKPVWQNVRSFGHIMSAFNESDKEVVTKKEEVVEKKESKQNLPTFFID